MKTLRAIVVALALLVASQGQAGEIGHFAPGVPGIRDLVIPGPGVYVALYSYWYTTDRLNDPAGNQVSAVTINPRGSPVTLALDLDVDVFALTPLLIWVPDWKLGGAKFGAYILPSFANSSVAASLQTASGRGIAGGASGFGVADLFVQPLWVGWAGKHVDLALGYGFYAPVGRYHLEETTLPIAGTITTEALDNIGLGFWTHQVQGAVTVYPWENKGTAIATALTSEFNGNKRGFDFEPGAVVTFNWGISQFLPLVKDKLLLELGFAGYDTWQITDDSSSDEGSAAHDQVHALGGQVGLTVIPWGLGMNIHGFAELHARDRFQGASLGFNLAKKL